MLEPDMRGHDIRAAGIAVADKAVDMWTVSAE